jgi:acetolactate synthase regulatory subunit
VFSRCPRGAGHRSSALPKWFFHSLLDRFLVNIEHRAFHIAQIATGDADEAMHLVHVVRSAAYPRLQQKLHEHAG